MSQNLKSLLVGLDIEFCEEQLAQLRADVMDFTQEARAMIERKTPLSHFVCALRDDRSLGLGVQALQGATVMLALLLEREKVITTSN